MPTTDVLIVGAGPTGLVLALWLSRLGVSVRIIDKAAEAGTTSRALGVQARTLELYQQLGLAQTLVDRGLKFAAANLWVRGRKVARAAFGEMGEGLSPFPYMLIYPQDEHERFLIERLAEQGVEIERRTELIDFQATETSIIARLRMPDGLSETCEVRYLAGADGAHSRVREVLSIGFIGSTYPHVFYVADVEAAGPQINYELHVALDDADFLAVFPLKTEGHARIIGTVKWELDAAPKSLMWSDVSKDVINRLGLEVAKVNWFSTYRVHHRVADQFRRGRAFLVGDAAHIHSPVGAQGMNTGIADAINLAWKLGAVIQDRAHEAILDTYQPERIAFARRLVATTDRVFTAVTSPGSLARLIRTLIVPAILPTLTTIGFVRRLMFLTISQTGVSYRKSSLSEGRAGSIHGGDRLPWLADHSGGNFKSLVTDWQLHICGEASDELKGLCERRSLPLHSFVFSAEAKAAGFKVATCYLVRPDGYIGLVVPLSGLDSLERYLDRHGLRTNEACPPTETALIVNLASCPGYY